MVKDLGNAKALAALLEDEYLKLRQTPTASTINGASEANGDSEQPDAHMVEHSEDTEPKERGSEAVERRIEKVLAELRDHGLLDPNDEKAMEERRVCDPLVFKYSSADQSFTDGNCS